MPKKGLSGEQDWHWERADPQCELNTLEYPAGSTPLHQVFEEFAAENQKWVDEFVPALEKMLSNGYTDLTLGPDQFTGVKCPRFNPWDGSRYSNCYIDSETQSKTSYLHTCVLAYASLPEGQCDGNFDLLQVFQPITEQL